MWTERYRPKRLEEMVGNERARVLLFDWLLNWKRGMKPILLVGPPGVGKTTMAYAAAMQLGYEVIELNASDFRTEKQLSKVINASYSSSLTEEKRILFLDEVDGLYGKADYGGAEYLTETIEQIPLPVIMAANDPDAEQVKKLSKHAKLVRMQRVPSRLIEMLIKDLLAREGFSMEGDKLQSLVKAADGDIRAAVNNAQLAAAGEDQFQVLRKTLSLKDAISAASSAEELQKAVEYLRQVDADPDQKLMACYSSLVNSSLDRPSLRDSLKLLAEASLLLKRIRSTQQWRQLRYFDRMLATSLYMKRIAYAEEPLPWSVRQRVWNDSRFLKRFCSIVASELRTSASEFALNNLSAALLIISKSGNGIESWCAARNMLGAAFNALDREVKMVIPRIER
ncbi:MAG: AAA family ATPase [Conexivisphaerales archaeon]